VSWGGETELVATRDLMAVLFAAGYKPYLVRQGRVIAVSCYCGMLSDRIGPFCHDDPPMPESGKQRILDSLRSCFLCGRGHDGE
jgi:hypothetical protein